MSHDNVTIRNFFSTYGTRERERESSPMEAESVLSFLLVFNFFLTPLMTVEEHVMNKGNRCSLQRTQGKQTAVGLQFFFQMPFFVSRIVFLSFFSPFYGTGTSLDRNSSKTDFVMLTQKICGVIWGRCYGNCST